MNLQKFVLSLFISMLSLSSFADVSVQGYYRDDGTYVPPHHRSEPNNTKSDNWSHEGNRNPYTGEWGTKD